MENSTKALLLGAGVLITLVIISMAIMFLNASKEMAKGATDEISHISQDLSQMKYDVYDGTTVSGSQALNEARKHINESTFGVKIETGRNATGVWYGSVITETGADIGTIASGTALSVVTGAIDETDVNYINPSGKFDAVLLRDASGVTRGVVFSQQ